MVNPEKGKILEDLLRLSPGANEADRRQKISVWLGSNGISNWIEYPIKEGRADIHLQHRHCIIETKTHVQLNKGIHTRGTGAREKESAYQQLCRYVESDRSQLRLDSMKLSWLGVITDGRRWHIFEWPLLGDGDKVNEIYRCEALDRERAARIAQILERNNYGKPWVPDNIKEEFDPYKEELMRMYRRMSVIKEIKTKKKLWLAQLKSGGNAPSEEDADDLFVTHTLIILISRMATNRRDREDLYEGFAGWVRERGDDIIKRLQNKVSHFNWAATQGDILRLLYEKTVDPSQRQLYGEFYTPDWLCEKIVCDTVDTRYMVSEARKFLKKIPINGILDPSCGSGTFLYYAAKRIIESKDVQAVFRDDEKLHNFALQMITGIDIHPVAVEMATANIRRILNTRKQVRIYQGDSIMLPHEDISLYSSVGQDILTVFTPKNHMLKIPLKFLEKDSNIKRFVSAAANGDKSLPDDLVARLGKSDMEQLIDAYKTMLKVVKDEGNDVWGWYINNQAKPLLLSRGNKAGRIVANPPWVLIRKMDWDADTRRHVKQLSERLGLWPGGKDAPNFDVSALFVSRCIEKYLVGGGRSSWVLQESALKDGKAWSTIRKKHGSRMTTWALGTTAFNRPSCVLLMGQGRAASYLYVSGCRFDGHETWNAVKPQIRIKRDREKFKWSRSEWYSGPSSMLARSGATIIPSPLVRIQNITEENPRSLTIETIPTAHKRWRIVGALSGTIPKSFAKDCVFSTDLIPFHIPTTSKCVIPVQGTSWIHNRKKVQFWSDACQIYGAHRKDGNPETLEGNLDSTGKLIYQLRNNKNMVVYNKAGSRLYAALNHEKHIVDRTIQFVLCRSEKEAWFLCSVLNADCLQDAYRATKQNPLDYVRFFWEKIPIPRYDPKNDVHVKLSGLGRQAHLTVRRGYAEDTCLKARKSSLGMLRESGHMEKIDLQVKKILPGFSR
ncbi:MAG: N-6 DNA methylase [Nitrosopumilus sp.]|nr:N-6 DNA methylase [Nitrosopumilus sp.]CAI9832295.1 hypothetical protein IBTHAUMO2_700006 [Nitrosopumilaceae archaeon]MDA7953788.1 N-6 DNA methylase [Nitrosopumilus sp.]MDA7959072.1 N-6 DNA methylase [Nitrosopumilus sp.]MDA7974508.1 N-6 DNA methylase [Nitrosopumilus sp.]